MDRAMKTLRTACSLLLCGLVLGACGGSGSSPPPPARVPINTGTGWSDSPFISRDGKRLYFMYSRYNFGPWLLRGEMPLPTGPDRPGLHKSSTNPFDESDIYVATRQDDGSWSEPVNLGLNGAYGDASGMELDGGNTFIWLQGNGSTSNIVMARKNADGSWAAPTDLGPAVNDHSVASTLQDNPHLSPDGNALWFTSSRSGGAGGKDIWFSWKANGAWSAPVDMGAPVDTGGDEDQVWISPVSADVYWRGPAGLMHCLSNGSNCAGTPTVVNIPGCAYAAEASMPDDGQTLYFACGDPATGMVRIMRAAKQADGSWGTATPVD